MRRAPKAYVYAIIVDGIVRYVGKGRGTRLFVHLIDATRSAARCGRRTAHLSPRLHRKLVEAIRAGSSIVERVIVSALPNSEAYRLEANLIAHSTNFTLGSCGIRSTSDLWTGRYYQMTGRIPSIRCIGFLARCCSTRIVPRLSLLATLPV